MLFSESDPCPSGSTASADCDIDDDDLPLVVIKLSRECFDCDVKELATLDCNLAKCNTAEINWDLPISELLENIDSDRNDE